MRERRLKQDSGIHKLLENELKSEVNKWIKLRKRIIDVVIFLGERGLPFRGSTKRIHDVHNGNFLGNLELIAHYDPVLEWHIEKVRDSQKREMRLQVHYLSSDSQNEFIDLCANEIRPRVLQEVANAKYCAIMVDATPDVAHVEQTFFVLRYLVRPGIIECGDSSNE